MCQEQPAIRLRDVGVFRDGRWILRGINWTIEPGSMCAILGPNGSGKSTLARILATHLWPTAGEVQVLGGEFGSADLTALRKSIRLVQPAGPYDVDHELTAREIVLTGFFGTLGLYDSTTPQMEATAERLLAQVGLARVADHVYGTLSSGERIRAVIARALASEPALLLLDEPTAGLDLLAREQVLATVQSLFAPGRRSITAVLITHHVEELPPNTREILLLDDGRMAGLGAPQAVLKSELLSEVYGCPLEVRHADGRYSIHVHPGAWTGLLGPKS